MKEPNFYFWFHKLIFGCYPIPVTHEERQFLFDKLHPKEKDRVDFLASIHGKEIYELYEEIKKSNEQNIP